MKSLILVFLLSCSPTYRIVQHYRGVPKPQTCPTFTMLLGDVGLAGIGLALSTLAYSNKDYVRAGVTFTLGMGIALGANLAETTCR